MKIFPRWICGLALLSLVACKDDKPKGSTPAPDKSAAAAPSSAAPPPKAAASSKHPVGPRPRAGALPAPAPTINVQPAKRDDIKATPGAHLHLPDKCDVMGHIDVAGTLAIASIKEQLMPQFQAALKSKPRPGSPQRSLYTFLDKSAINPLEDIRSLAFCLRGTAGQKPTLVAIMGGQFAPSVVAKAAVAANPRQYQLGKRGGVEVATVGKSQIVGQAKDGVILLATGEELFEAALGTGKAAAQAKLATDKTLSAIITATTLKAAAERGGPSPFKPHLMKAKRVVHATDLKTGKSVTRIEMPDKTSAVEFGGALKAALTQLDGNPQMRLPPGLVALLKDTKISYQGSNVVITLSLPKEKIAALLKTALTMMAPRPGGPMMPQRPGGPMMPQRPGSPMMPQRPGSPIMPKRP